jgi:hypothetical protein
MTSRFNWMGLLRVIVLILLWLTFGFFSGRFSTQVGCICSVFLLGAGVICRIPSLIGKCWRVLIAVVAMCFVPWDIGIRRGDSLTLAVRSVVILQRNASSDKDLIYTGHGIALLPRRVIVIYLPTEGNIMTPFGFAVR